MTTPITKSEGFWEGLTENRCLRAWTLCQHPRCAKHTLLSRSNWSLSILSISISLAMFIYFVSLSWCAFLGRLKIASLGRHSLASFADAGSDRRVAPLCLKVLLVKARSGVYNTEFWISRNYLLTRASMYREFHLQFRGLCDLLTIVDFPIARAYLQVYRDIEPLQLALFPIKVERSVSTI